MRKPRGLKARPAPAAKTSVVELTVLAVLGALAGVGAGLAFESAAIGLAVAALALVAVSAYGAAANVGRWPRDRRETPPRLSVTEIAARRPQPPGPASQGRPARPAADKTADVAPDVAKAVEPERVVPFRAPLVR